MLRWDTVFLMICMFLSGALCTLAWVLAFTRRVVDERRATRDERCATMECIRARDWTDGRTDWTDDDRRTIASRFIPFIHVVSR